MINKRVVGAGDAGGGGGEWDHDFMKKQKQT